MIEYTLNMYLLSIKTYMMTLLIFKYCFNQLIILEIASENDI